MASNGVLVLYTTYSKLRNGQQKDFLLIFGNYLIIFLVNNKWNWFTYLGNKIAQPQNNECMLDM